MFKKSHVILLLLTFVILSACSNDKADLSKVDTDDGGKTVEVDKGLMNVEITFPAVLFENQNVDDIIENAKAEGVSEATKNDDGSLTYKMPKSVHKKMVEEMEEDIVNLVNETKGSTDFPSIEDITYNKKFSEFTLVVEKEAYENSFDGFASLTLGMSGMYYQVFNGEKAEDIKVKISVKDEATGEVFHDVTYPDALDEQ